MSLIWIILALIIFSYILQKFKNKNKNLPPGPKGYPILGNLHLLGAFPHHDLYHLAQKHGPIMFMKLGLVPAIVVSSPKFAELFLKTYDHVFASRPPHLAAKHISYDQKNLSFSPYGSYWRDVRKMCTLELLSNLKINSFRLMRKQELSLLIDTLKEAASGLVVVDLSSKVSSLSANMSCLMVFGKKYMDNEFDKRGFRAVIQEVMQLAAIPNLGDYIPFIAGLDLQGLTKRMKGVAKVFDNFFERIIDEHIQSKDEHKTKDFVDVMLGFMGNEETEYRIDRPHIKAIILDMLVGSMDTVTTTIDWAMAELMKHPQVMKKLQKELQLVIGLDRMVEESDLENLKYLDMVIKETFRIHPVAPLSVPHQSIEDYIVEGFHIPAKSRIIVNLWAIGRDPSVWDNADKFMPERFIDSEIDVKGRHFQLLPFGSGRRGCPGMQLGLIVVRLVLAQLVHCFDWELPNGMLPNELDMTEEFGLTCPRAKHLMVVPTYRLHK